MRSVSDLMNMIRRDPKQWFIKVVSNAEPNEDGRWLDCGFQALPDPISFRETANRLSKFCPARCHIVAVSNDKNVCADVGATYGRGRSAEPVADPGE